MITNLGCQKSYNYRTFFDVIVEFSFVCEGGTLDYHSGLRRLTLYKGDGSSQEPTLSEQDGFVGELSAFVDACEAGAAPERCPPEESALATRMALAMRTSRERGGEPVAV